jgi:hypothetical protein
MQDVYGIFCISIEELNFYVHLIFTLLVEQHIYSSDDANANTTWSVF